jgi:ABC-type amino acid transport substrate-binding protein
MRERAAAVRLRLRRWSAWVKRHPRAMLSGLIMLALLILGWRLTRPGARFGPQDGTWIRVQTNKDLYVGLDPDYPPFTEWTPDQIDGLEADIAREIGDRLGVKTQILIMGTDSLYDSLYTGYVDMIISGLHVDPTLKEWVHYTRPYYDAGQILVAQADSPVDDIRDLDGKTVAVEIASAGDLAAQRWKRRLHALDVRRYMLPNDAMLAVQNGEADAALVDTVSARLYLDQHDDLVMAPNTTVPDGYVIALRKANFRLTAAVDRALDDMIADGTLDVIIARWL